MVNELERSLQVVEFPPAALEQRTKKITAQEQALQPSKPAPTMLPV